MQSSLATGDRQLDWSGVELPAEQKDGHEVAVRVSFGEFAHDGERYFTGVVAPVDVDDELRESLENAHEQVVDACDRHDDEALADAAAAISDVLDRLEQ